LDVRRLGYFMRIAEDGSLTKASAVLRIAQPALSRQMRLLEEELGVALFSRTARGMRLTEEGAALRASVAGPLRELELALQNIKSFPFAAEANIAIGLPTGLADRLATPLALRIDQEFPNIKLRIVEGITGSLIDWLSRGVVDFVVVEEEPHHDQLQVQKLAVLPLVLVGSPASPLPREKPITFTEAVKLPLVLPSHHLGLRAVINDAAMRAQAKLNIRMEADSARLTKDLLRGGLGYAIMPACYCQEELDAARLQNWPLIEPELSPALSINIVIASRKNSQLTGPRVRALEGLISRIAVELLQA
jgi:LysR family transcriptional regulator, nitrogen assimilation regulatory protein